MKIWILISIITFFLSIIKASGHELVGFWHNWNDSNAPYIQLDSIDNRYTYITVAFSVPTSATDMNMLFTPEYLNTTQFISKMRTLQNRGKKVLLSIGGAYSYFDLSSESNKNAFINTLSNLMQTYGFDGLDIDIEHGNCILITGGTIATPSNQSQINLIDAIRQIMASYRSNFSRKMILTVSPETAYVQGGQSGFGNIWGGYLPILHALRDSIDILQVQLYNSGTMYGLDGNIYSQGTADFVVAMTEAVIMGFNTNGGFFQGFPANKVTVGLPASPNAAGGGYIDSSALYSAVNYLIGKGTRSGNYIMIQSSGYPNLLGMMTWSINWDAVLLNGSTYQYANSYANIFIGTLPEKVVLFSPEAGNSMNNPVKFVWRKSQPQVSAYQLNIYLGNNLMFSDSTLTDTTKIISNLQYGSEYNWKVRAKNNYGWGTWSDTRYFRTFSKPDQVVTLYPTNSEQIIHSKIDFIWNKTIPNVTDYQLEIGMDGVAIFSDSTIKDTIFTFNNLKPRKLYSWMVRAKSNSIWGDWSTIKMFSTISLPDQVQQVFPKDNDVLSENNVVLVWQGNKALIDHYLLEIYCEKEMIVSDSNLTDTVYALNNLNMSKKYSWRVKAKNDFGSGNWSVLRSFRYLSSPEKVELLLPANHSIWLQDSVLFTWMRASKEVISYSLEIYENDSLIFFETNINDTVFQMLMPNSNYSWRVRAKNELGEGDWSEIWYIKKDDKDIELPQQVILLFPEDNSKISETYVKLIWLHTSPDVINYQLKISENDLIIITEFSLTDTIYVFDNIKQNYYYTWQVRAINSSGVGPWSNLWKFYHKEIINFIDFRIIENRIILSPNPAFDYIEVDLNNLMLSEVKNIEFNVRVYNVLGMEVLKTTIQSLRDTLPKLGVEMIRIDISGLPPGVYFVQIGSRVQRFVKF